ncbi:MAG: hypothetical protein Q8L48_10405 [Archangium sp.]|nr:hypothetical protein [Archangium sp.]
MILELMESVAALEATGAEQTERFDDLATQFGVMATQMSALATQVNALTLGARASQAQLARVARLIFELADDHQRIEGLEVRVGKLERKAG